MEPMDDRSAAEEMAAAEAQLKAAQERVEAARQRMAAQQAAPQAAGQVQQPQPGQAPQQPGVAAGGYDAVSAGQQFAQPGQPYVRAQGQVGQPYVQPGPAYGQPQGQAGPAYSQPTSGSSAPGAPYGYPGQQAYVPPTIGEKDHVAAGLLALFLGWLGVHKFYLGYNTAGFIMLGVSILGGILTLSVASWAIWVIAIVEGIFYLTKSQTEFEQMYVLNKREWF